ncbi:glycosyltransferase [Actinoplanes sp. LDG1-06]|uniref:Glycosyltransferase n=1 Tax=Paractinoplanes ovalisporus TaxID=2810368 RepID=A0ABS2A590_9ACTN|nr:glycosyltransferase [Actinoplanes ovalisporus]MBM2615015.1 glycosyltransferase [Actinoplanes ovalisporus]
MPRHRNAGRPRAHWSIFVLALAALVATLFLDDFAQETGGGTVPPGETEIVERGSAVSGPVIHATGGTVVAERLPPRTVALTFDDGPDPRWTPRILDVLRRHSATATFFVVGSQVNKYPDLTRRIVADGHQLGLHSFTHRDLAGMSGPRRRIEFELTRNAVAHATGQDVKLFRPPYLASPAKVDRAALDLIEDAGRSGFTTVLADRDTTDWRRPTAKTIANRAMPVSSAGAIVLMHDGGGDRSNTVEALDLLLPRLAAQNRRVVTVSAALPSAPVAAEASARAKLQGGAFAVAQTGAGWTRTGMFWLMIFATALAGSRMAIQAWCAWRHSRRRRRQPLAAYGDPVSVIVPAFNEAANIVATVRSLLASDHPEVEIIVVDDGSTDGTADLVDGHFPVRVLRRPNGGKASALRAGVAAARHDILVLIDGDTIVEPDTIGMLVRSFADPAVGAVAGNAKVANRRGVIGRWQHLEYVVAFNLDRRVFEMGDCMTTVPGALGGFRRAALEAAGGVRSDTLAEDTDLTMAVVRAGWRVVYDDMACAWTEAPGTWKGLWRQRYRWCYGTMQAMWKHRAALRERGPAGRFGRRGLGYVALFQILQPLLAPIIDIYLIYALLFRPPGLEAVFWLGIHVAQFAVAAYAFRLDKEPAGPLWSLPLLQIGYRQLIYLVTIQSAVTALAGGGLRWHVSIRTGRAAALVASLDEKAARTQLLVRQIRLGLYRDPRWARYSVRAGLALIVLSGGAVAGGTLLTDRYANAVSREDLLGEAASYHAAPDDWDLDRALNILMIGVDWRKGQTGMIRSDTVMVLHVPKSKDRAFLFSLPRDTIVDIPPLAATGFRGGRDRLNSSFAYGAGIEQNRAQGGRLLAATVRKLTGLPGLDAAVLVDFYGFSDVVKALGGMNVCVDADVRSIHTQRLFRAGCRTMTGEEAIDYLRQRKKVKGSDYGRQHHQQQFIGSIAAEAKRQNLAANPVKLDSLLRAAGQAMTVTTGPVEPIDWAFALRGINPDRITMLQTPGSGRHDAAGNYLGEALDPAAYAMFRALREEKLPQFVTAHPEMVGRPLA